MPIYRLCEDIIFPPPELAAESGVLAVGGDLSPRRLVEAYRTESSPGIRRRSRSFVVARPGYVLFPDESGSAEHAKI